MTFFTYLIHYFSASALLVDVLVTVFCYCDKMPERNNLKTGIIYFGSLFQSVVTLFSCFWACGEAEHHEG
jgi:hypothetical protein